MANEEKTQLRLEIAHVLFIDIVGYSKLRISQQSELLHELNEIVTGTKEFRAADSEGKLIRLPTGDGMALVFRTTPEAPAICALEISQALKEHHPDIHLRMGIHSGPVSEVADVNQRANIAGAGINLAQRVMDCGDAGHILVSKHVAEDLEQYDHWQPCLHDLGECEVKHGVRVHLFNLYTDDVGNSELPEKFKSSGAATIPPARKNSRTLLLIAATGLVVAGLIAFWFTRKNAGPAATAAPEKSIAVLPFENLSSDKENAYFADGIQDEILTRLSKIADLKVISRTSTQHYKSAPANLPEIAKQLGVAHIVEGSVQKSSDAVRVNVQLIKAANDTHLWADTYDRRLIDIFSVESEVAKAIAEQLRAKLTGSEEQVIADRPTDNVEAYDAYLRGLANTLGTAITPANALAAQKYLREAVRLDPKFALAWALLSSVDAIGYRTERLQATIALCEEARLAAETALTLQPNLGEAIMAKGEYYYCCAKDFGAAARYFEQARQFLPSSSRIPESLGIVARRLGQWDRSESYFDEAEQLDPHNVSLLATQAETYRARRRFPQALRKLDEILDITPDDITVLIQKTAIAQAEGDLARAAAFLARLHSAADNPYAFQIKAYQAILERRPAPIISPLKEILAKPDPTLGYYNGDLRFWLGWAQEIAGDNLAARESWRQARNELNPLLKEQPDNKNLIGDLALINMGLGDKATALALAERAMAEHPIDKDAIDGPNMVEIFARVAAGTGEPDRAIAALQKLLLIPYSGALTTPLTPALLRLDPMFDPLRNDPRFQQLASDTLTGAKQ